MEFIYDSVFGLIYTDNPIISIDISYLPKNFNTEELLQQWKQYQSSGLMWVDTSPPIEIINLPIYSNY